MYTKKENSIIRRFRAKLWAGIHELLSNPLAYVVLGFIILALRALWLGSLYDSIDHPPRYFPEAILINLAPELAGIAIGVLSIDLVNKKRQENELKRRLIRQLGSRYDEIVDTALKELRHHGWIKDGSLIGADLAMAALGDAVLIQADLCKSDLRSAVLACANLTDAKLCDADLGGANLQFVRCNSADFARACLSFSDLSFSAPVWCNFSDSDLIWTNLTEANLTGANFRNANLSRARLYNAKLHKADLRGANLYVGMVDEETRLEEVDITINQLKEAILDENTCMPNGEYFSGWHKDYGIK